jgi:uncharacterized protein Veg
MTICSKKMKTIRRGVEDTLKKKTGAQRENGRKRSKKLGR